MGVDWDKVKNIYPHVYAFHSQVVQQAKERYIEACRRYGPPIKKVDLHDPQSHLDITLVVWELPAKMQRDGKLAFKGMMLVENGIFDDDIFEISPEQYVESCLMGFHGGGIQVYTLGQEDIFGTDRSGFPVVRPEFILTATAHEEKQRAEQDKGPKFDVYVCEPKTETAQFVIDAESKGEFRMIDNKKYYRVVRDVTEGFANIAAAVLKSGFMEVFPDRPPAIFGDVKIIPVGPSSTYNISTTRDYDEVLQLFMEYMGTAIEAFQKGLVPSADMWHAIAFGLFHAMTPAEQAEVRLKYPQVARLCGSTPSEGWKEDWIRDFDVVITAAKMDTDKFYTPESLSKFKPGITWKLKVYNPQDPSKAGIAQYYSEHAKNYAKKQFEQYGFKVEDYGSPESYYPDPAHKPVQTVFRTEMVKSVPQTIPPDGVKVLTRNTFVYSREARDKTVDVISNFIVSRGGQVFKVKTWEARDLDGRDQFWYYVDGWLPVITVPQEALRTGLWPNLPAQSQSGMSYSIGYEEIKAAIEGEGWAIGDYKNKLKHASSETERVVYSHIAKEEQQHLDELLELFLTQYRNHKFESHQGFDRFVKESVFAKDETEFLFEMLEVGVKQMLDHGEFGALHPAAAMRFDIMDELIRRGYTEDQIMRIVHGRIHGKLPTPEEERRVRESRWSENADDISLKDLVNKAKKPATEPLMSRESEVCSNMDVQLFTSPEEIREWYSAFPEAEVVEKFTTPFGLVAISDLKGVSMYKPRTWPGALTPMLDRWNVPMPADDPNGQLPETVWAGNLALNFATKMTGPEYFPEFNRDQLAAAMFWKLTKPQYTLPDGRVVDARYNWKMGRAKGVKKYVQEAMEGMGEAEMLQPGGPAPQIPGPEAPAPPAAPLAPVPGPTRQEVVIALPGQQQPVPAGTIVPRPTQLPPQAPSKRKRGRPPSPKTPRTKYESSSEYDVYDETAKVWAKAFSSPAEYQECRLKVREFMRNKKYPPKMLERIAEFAAKSYTGEQMETVYPALIRAIDDLSGVFHITDGGV